MCCSTGVCGPEVDPKLAQFAGDIDWLKGQGIDVRRINLAQESARFVEHPAVKALMDRSGGDELPAIMVGDSVVTSGRYPSRDELAAFVGLAAKPASAEMTEQMKELVALGAAIGASCEPCFKFHYDKARKLGIPTTAMREAVKIGEAVKAASAKNILGLADRMLGSAEPEGAAASCCGGSAGTQPGEDKTSKCC